MNAKSQENQTTEKTKGSILFLGASVTSGFGLPREEAYPAIIGELLMQKGTPYKILNAAAAGAGTKNGQQQLAPQLKKDNQVKMVVIALGLSDAVYNTAPDVTKNNLKNLVQQIKQFDVGIQVALVQADIFQHHVISRVPAKGSDYHTRYVAVFKEVAKEENILWVPFMLEGVAGEPQYNQSDQIHPNAAGAKIIARNIFKYIEQKL